MLIACVSNPLPLLSMLEQNLAYELLYQEQWNRVTKVEGYNYLAPDYVFAAEVIPYQDNSNNRKLKL